VGLRRARAHRAHVDVDGSARILIPMRSHPEDPPRSFAHRHPFSAATRCPALQAMGAEPPWPARSGGCPPGARGLRRGGQGLRSFRNERNPKEWRKAGTKRAEGEIKGCGLFALKSLDGFGVSLDTTGGVYPRERASLGPTSSFLVARKVDA
jgi:hypothetical protein